MERKQELSQEEIRSISDCTADIDGGEEITGNHLVKDIVSIMEDQFR